MSPISPTYANVSKNVPYAVFDFIDVCGQSDNVYPHKQECNDDEKRCTAIYTLKYDVNDSTREHTIVATGNEEDHIDIMWLNFLCHVNNEIAMMTNIGIAVLVCNIEFTFVSLQMLEAAPDVPKQLKSKLRAKLSSTSKLYNANDANIIYIGYKSAEDRIANCVFPVF